MEELALIEALKNPIRSEKAFAILVETYKERLYWHIRRIVLQHDFADDVLQNTFIKVFRNLDGFKGESKLFSWMYRIATNEALTYLKTEAKKGGVPLGEYQEKQLETQLIQATRSFLMDSSKNILNKNKLKLSKIFFWFKKDFGSKKERLDFIKKYSDLEYNKPVIDYLDYDWSLNTQ